jgi:type II secretory pathway component PulF
MMLEIKALVRPAKGPPQRITTWASSLEGFREELEEQGGDLLELVTVREHDDGPQRFSAVELIDFLEGVATLSGAGLTLQHALDVAVLLRSTPRISMITRGIRDDLQKGTSLGASLSARIRGLPPLVAGMIGIGEKTGRLDQVLPPLVAYLKLMHRMREKLVSASLYPALIIVLGLAGVMALLFFVIPQLERSLSLGNTPAGDTLTAGFTNLRLILGAIGVSLGVPVLAFAAYRLSRHRGTGLACRLESLLFKVPVIGNIIRTTQLQALSFSLELLSANNVRLDEALGYASASLWSLSLRDLLENAAADLQRGVSLSQALDREGGLPEYFIRWIQIAEQTGKASHAFGQLRAYYERELDKQMSRVMTMIEPLLIALIGVLLVAAIVTVVLPLFSVYSMGLK